MSLAYSNTSTKNGLLQLCEKNCLLGDGGITSNATLKAQFTADINLALDEVMATIFGVGGTWQFDDTNQTDYPIITTDLVLGQRDYSFTTDEAGNLILDIYRVLVKNPAGQYSQIYPVDVSSGQAPMSYVDGLNTTGQPSTYDKLANGIFLDPIPNYNATAGLKIYINREGSYFTTSDTTKKPGFAGLFHEYLALKPSYNYASLNNLSTATSLFQRMTQVKNDLIAYYQAREKDVMKIIRPIRYSSR
jgi:hypothetical protein